MPTKEKVASREKSRLVENGLKVSNAKYLKYINKPNQSTRLSAVRTFLTMNTLLFFSDRRLLARNFQVENT